MALYPGAPRPVTRSAVSRGPLPLYTRLPTAVSGTGPRPPLFGSSPTIPPFTTNAFQGMNTPASSRPVSQTLSQVANQRVNAQLNPQIQAADAFNTRQNAVIQSFANALLGKLQPIAGQVGQQYDQAIQETGQLSGQAAQFLSNANPTGQVQQLLQSAGAPQSQQDQIAAQLGQTFGGGAGVLQFTGGVIPGQELAQDKVAQIGTPEQPGPLAQLPALAALKGQQDLASALWQQGQDRRTLEATRPALYQQAAQDIRTNNAARQRAAATAQQNAITNRMATTKFNEGVSEFNQTRSDKQAIATSSAIAKANTNSQANVQKFVAFTTSPGFLKEQWDTASLVNLAKTGYGITLPKGFQAPTVTPAAAKPNWQIISTAKGQFAVNKNDPTQPQVYVGANKPSKGAGPTFKTAKDGTILSIAPNGSVTPIYTPAPGAAKIDLQKSRAQGRWVDSNLNPVPVPAGTKPPPPLYKPTSAKPTKVDVSQSKIRGKWVDSSGNLIPWLQSKGIARPTAATTSAPVLSAEGLQKETAAVNAGVNLLKSGGNYDANGKYSPGGGYAKDGTPLPAVANRTDAIAEARAHGYFSTPQFVKIAMAAINRLYPPPSAAGARAYYGTNTPAGPVNPAATAKGNALAAPTLRGAGS